MTNDTNINSPADITLSSIKVRLTVHLRRWDLIAIGHHIDVTLFDQGPPDQSSGGVGNSPCVTGANDDATDNTGESYEELDQSCCPLGNCQRHGLNIVLEKDSRYALAVFGRSSHIGDGILIGMQDFTGRVDVRRRHHTDKVLKYVKVGRSQFDAIIEGLRYSWEEGTKGEFVNDVTEVHEFMFGVLPTHIAVTECGDM